jgi:hypothetical protein
MKNKNTNTNTNKIPWLFQGIFFTLRYLSQDHGPWFYLFMTLDLFMTKDFCEIDLEIFCGFYFCGFYFSEKKE